MRLGALTASRAGRTAAVAALCAFALAFQGARGIWSPDEGRYVNVAMQMLRSGDWLYPRLDDDTAHLAKPPLTYWAIALSVRLWGCSETAVRLPNAAAFVGAVLTVYALGKRLTPARPWLPALIYATSALPCLASNIVTTDTILAFWETLAVLGFVELWWGSSPRRAPAARLVMWVAFGMGFATKGPPALLPLAAILAFACYSRRWAGARALLSVTALLAFLVLALWWYLLTVAREPAALRYFLLHELVGRVTGRHGRNPRWHDALRVYGPALLLGMLPWTWALLCRAPASWRFLRQVRRPGMRRGGGRDLFLFLWLLLPLAVLVVTPSRLPLYALPLCAPLALLLARHYRWERSRLPVRPGWLAAWVVVLVGLRWGAGIYDTEKDGRPLARAIRSSVPFSPAEVVFVDTGRVFGLSLYLSAEIERVELGDEPSGPGGPRGLESFAEEVAEDEPDTLYVVPAARAEEFRVRATALRQRVEALGGLRDLRFFRLHALGEEMARDGVRS